MLYHTHTHNFLNRSNSSAAIAILKYGFIGRRDYVLRVPDAIIVMMDVKHASTINIIVTIKCKYMILLLLLLWGSLADGGNGCAHISSSVKLQKYTV